MALLLVIAVVACRTEAEPSAGPKRPSVTTEPPGHPCDPNGDCPLKAAAARADLFVGTAAKLGDPERRAVQEREFSALSVERELLWSVVSSRRRTSCGIRPPFPPSCLTG